MVKKSLYIAANIILLLTLGAVVQIQTRGTPKIISNPLNEIPLNLDGFNGANDQYPESVYNALNADAHIFRHYQNAAGQVADLYIGYYSTAKGGRSPHTPFGCLPGAGWGIEKNEIAKLTPEGYAQYVEVNSISAVKGNLNLVMLHWYQVEGEKVLKSGIAHNLQRLKNRIFNNRSDGAFIQVSAISDFQNLNAAEANVKKLATAIIGIIPRYWPVEGT